MVCARVRMTPDKSETYFKECCHECGHRTQVPQTTRTVTGRMKALVYHGPGKRAWEETPRPAIENATDAVVRITTSTICGTDLHILKGDLPSVTPGRILGHEGIGVVIEAGPAVTAVRPGDRVIISCVTACGKCDYCRKGMYSHCRDGGWILGNTIDGTQAELVRIPHADMSLYHFPPAATKKHSSCSATSCRPASSAAC